MASGITTAFWGMTINNYDETDLALVRQGYSDYVREIVYTLEKGQEGTPHIQAWVKLQRQQRLSFVKKLFPRGHFKPLTSDVYIAHTKQYAQKLDDTAQSAAVHKFNDPIHTVESVIKKVCLEIMPYFEYEEYSNKLLLDYRYIVEKRMVESDYRYAKIFVSSVYCKMWNEFGPSIYHNIVNTHTHTHTDEKFSRQDTKNGYCIYGTRADDPPATDDTASTTQGSESDRRSEGTPDTSSG